MNRKPKNIFFYLDKIGGFITYFRNFFVNSLFLIILFFGVIIGIISAVISQVSDNEKEIDLSKKSVMIIKFAGSVADTPRYNASADEIVEILTGEKIEHTFIRDIVNSIKYATNGDSPINHIIIDASNLSNIRLDQVETIGNSLKAFTEQGKKVSFYSKSYSQAKYALASYANNIYLDPMGSFTINGLTIENIYFKELLDNLGVTVYTPKAGTHKSAIEPFIRTNMSEHVKKEYQEIVNTIWSQYKEIVTSNKPNVNLDEVLYASEAYLNNLAKYKTECNLAKELGFVDFCVSKEEFISKFEKDRNIVVDNNNHKTLEDINLKKTNSIDYLTYLKKTKNKRKTFNQKEANVDVIFGIGEITDIAEDITSFSPENIVPLIKKSQHSKKSKGIILYLNTPGGSVTASEEIRRALVDYKKSGKKIVAYMTGTTASGGYWISSLADSIVAHPSTITGSIGVFALSPSFEKMANKYGITTDGVTTNNNANRSILSKQTENEAKTIQLHIDNTYELFKNYVSEDRKIKMDIVNQIAQGRIYTGSQAIKKHLVDELGDFNKAFADLKNLIHSDSTYIIKYRLPKEKNNLGNFSKMFVKAMAKFNQNVALELFNILQDNSNIKALLPKHKANTKTEIKSFMPLVVTEAK